MRCVRVMLAKKGRAKYTSHLDMQRCMMRAVRRAKIDLWYTEGFNPHPYVTFALPLPLGVESDGEPVDIRLEGDISNTELRRKLNPVLPEGIEVTKVVNAVNKPGDIAFAKYSIVLYCFEGAKEKIKAALDGGNLPAEKTGKSGRHKVTKQVNIAEMMGEYTLRESGGYLELDIVLAAGSTRNASPFLLLDALRTVTGEEIEYKTITRKSILMSNLEEF